MEESARFISDIELMDVRMLHLDVSVSPIAPKDECTVTMSVNFPLMSFSRVDGGSRCEENLRLVLDIKVNENSGDEREVISAVADVIIAVGGEFPGVDDESAEHALIADAAVTAYEFARAAIHGVTSQSPVQRFYVPSTDREGLLAAALRNMSEQGEGAGAD